MYVVYIDEVKIANNFQNAGKPLKDPESEPYNK
ncbi:hypothetical protein CHFL109739_20320 [Chryseobacterium flavum]